MAAEEAGEARIGRQSAQEIVGDGRYRVVAAEALVERRRRLLSGNRRCNGEGEDKSSNACNELHGILLLRGEPGANTASYERFRSADARRPLRTRSGSIERGTQ